ncbi:MAG: PadR family transcriptional regulator [Gemmatimonadaceae bacterium]|nr:PadR family transcriptional regulator [Gemmatimonadaceae bacterium]
MERPSTQFAVLGMLAIAPMSGYEMRQRIAGSVSHFWSESFGQLYPSLRTLAAEGLISGRETASERGGAKSVYHLTAAGRRVLRAWLAAPPRPQPVRNELLLKLFFAKDADAQTVRVHLEAMRARLRAEIGAYSAALPSIEADATSALEARCWRATVRYGVIRAEAALRWLDETLLDFPDPPTRARRSRKERA